MANKSLKYIFIFDKDKEVFRYYDTTFLLLRPLPLEIKYQ